MLAGSLFIVTGIVMIVRGWVRIYFAKGSLTTEGIYNLVRHRQYMGIFLVIIGQFIHWPTIPTLLLALAIVWLYVRLAKREDQRLLAKFGPPYCEYHQHVPMFVPHWHDLRQILVRF